MKRNRPLTTNTLSPQKKILSPKFGKKARVSAFTSFNIELGVLASAIMQDKKINSLQIGKEGNIYS